jgi:hypothetical protein
MDAEEMTSDTITKREDSQAGAEVERAANDRKNQKNNNSEKHCWHLSAFSFFLDCVQRINVPVLVQKLSMRLLKECLSVLTL